VLFVVGIVGGNMLSLYALAKRSSMPTRRRWQRNGPDVRAADRVDLLTDRRLIKAAVVVALAGAVPFAAVGWRPRVAAPRSVRCSACCSSG
jgi:hypothetical protein